MNIYDIIAHIILFTVMVDMARGGGVKDNERS